MSSIKTTQIDGDVSVGRNVAMGGKADIAGSVSIGHNLKVDGWLEAPNIKGANKGIFLTVQKLREAYPVPHDGWFAGVGASTPFDAYVGSGGDWVATGGTIEVTVDMSQYTEDVAQLQEDIDEVAARVQTAETNINSLAQQSQAEVGYYECSTAAAEAAKTIAATGYSLRSGGNIRIKMINANTADAVTLNINNTGAKALFYNGAQASSTNSWKAGEVVEVYYNGERYQCDARVVDDKPTAGSNNLVKSGGVKDVENALYDSIFVEDDILLDDELSTLDGYTITANGIITTSSVTNAKVLYIQSKKGDTFNIRNLGGSNNRVAFGIFSEVTEGSIAISYRNSTAQSLNADHNIIKSEIDGYLCVYSLNTLRICLCKQKFETYKSFVYNSYANSYIRNGNGSIRNDLANRRATGKIDVTNVSRLLYTRPVTDGTTATIGMAFYDENDIYISGQPQLLSDYTGYKYEILDVPSNAYYARFTLWQDSKYGEFKIYNADACAEKEIIKPIIDGEFAKSFAVTLGSGDFYKTKDNKGIEIRANVYMPSSDNCKVIVEKKSGASNDYQYAINGYNYNSDDHSIATTITTDYINKSGTYDMSGYSYIMIFNKNGSNQEISIDDILSTYNFTIQYATEQKKIILANNESRWNFHSCFSFGDSNNNTVVTSDYITKPKQKMKIRLDIPIWTKVRFRYGKREYTDWTSYYYAGDIVELDENMAAIHAEISLIDNRGINVDIYNKQTVGQQMSFTILDNYDKDIFSRNFDAEKYAGCIMATPNETEGYLPTIVHVSDIHGDCMRFSSAGDYADYIKADILVNTGDNPFFQMSQGVKWHDGCVAEHNFDFANCIGNHDTYISGLANVYNKNILPFASAYAYHKLNNNDVTDKCYYYKDKSDIQIRFIALDIYEGWTNAAYKARISSDQMNWFISTLGSTPQGYGVIVILHQAPHTISSISGKTNFNDVTMDPQIAAIDSDYMRLGKITGNPLGKIIDAFIGKGMVSDSYSQKNVSGNDETITYSADFTNLASGVEFIAYLNGHTHRDFIGYVADCEHTQLNINLCSTSPISQTTGLKTVSDIMRCSDGANQDAFNIYTINRTDKTVGIARVGSNLSKDLRDRKVMFVRYADEV